MIDQDGNNLGVVPKLEASAKAVEAGLDLVEISPDAQPPVCKIMDFGKFKYETAVKARETRRNQTHAVIKEMKLRPKIDPHDYETKKAHIERFLRAGDKVKVTVMFKGREQSRPELGIRLLSRLADDVAEDGVVEHSPKNNGGNLVMVIGPTRRKADVKSGAGKPAPRAEVLTDEVELEPQLRKAN